MTKGLVLFSMIVVMCACANIQTKRPELGGNSENGTLTSQVPSSLSPVMNETGRASNYSQVNLPSAIQSTNISVAPPAPAPKAKALTNGETPRIGLLLGPGGMRAFAHVGVIQEFVKAKIPVVAVVGLEMGALVGAIYASKGQTYDVEWQMSKLHEEDLVRKSLMSGEKPQDVTALKDFLQKSLGAAKAEDAKIPFACPAFQIEKRQVYMMSRGPYSSLLDYCLPFAPLFRPYDQNVAALTSIGPAVQFLRSRGANYIVYIDLLGEKKTPFFRSSIP
jgi:NTE family protein